MLSKECKVCVVFINFILSHECKKSKILLVIYIMLKEHDNVFGIFYYVTI